MTSLRYPCVTLVSVMTPLCKLSVTTIHTLLLHTRSETRTTGSEQAQRHVDIINHAHALEELRHFRKLNAGGGLQRTPYVSGNEMEARSDGNSAV